MTYSAFLIWLISHIIKSSKRLLDLLTWLICWVTKKLHKLALYDMCCIIHVYMTFIWFISWISSILYDYFASWVVQRRQDLLSRVIIGKMTSALRSLSTVDHHVAGGLHFPWAVLMLSTVLVALLPSHYVAAPAESPLFQLVGYWGHHKGSSDIFVSDFIQACYPSLSIHKNKMKFNVIINWMRYISKSFLVTKMYYSHQYTHIDFNVFKCLPIIYRRTYFY